MYVLGTMKLIIVPLNWLMNFKFRYVKSRNDEQLRSKDKANETSGCDPEKTTANGSVIVPCGLIAWSLFNDTYNFTHRNKNIMVNKTDISWKSDRDHKFGKHVYPKNFQTGGLIGGAHLDPKKPVSLFIYLFILFVMFYTF